MRTVILGSGSDIARALAKRMDVIGYPHDSIDEPTTFDLLLVCCGKVDEGSFAMAHAGEWEDCVKANVLTPLRWVRKFYPYRRRGASIVFFAGTDPNKVPLGMSAYHLSKIMLISAAELLNAEFDCKVFIIGPGYMPSKIHPYPVVGKQETSINDLHEMLMTCIQYPKSVIGGRNIHIRDPWKTLKDLNRDDYRLRRVTPDAYSL